MLVKIHKSYRDVIAICDSNLLGKRFEQGNLQIEIKSGFFNGEEKTEDEVTEIMLEGKTEDATFNIIGERAINLAIKNNLIDKNSVIKIQDIPIALILL